MGRLPDNQSKRENLPTLRNSTCVPGKLPRLRNPLQGVKSLLLPPLLLLLRFATERASPDEKKPRRLRRRQFHRRIRLWLSGTQEAWAVGKGERGNNSNAE
ncbi:unnamed protein product [Sphagnum balticum]